MIFTIRELEFIEIIPALKLVSRVFMEFEAPDYSPEGVDTFMKFISIPTIYDKIIEQNIKFWGAFSSDKIIGVIATRNINHICMFFVDGAYHKQGIGRKLFETAKDDIENNSKNTITVHSSPFAVQIYRKLGFVETNTEQIENGMRYTPMEFEIRI